MTQFRHQEGPQEMDGEYPATSSLDYLTQAQKRLKVVQLALHTLAPNLEEGLREDIEGMQFSLISIQRLLDTSKKNLIEAAE